MENNNRTILLYKSIADKYRTVYNLYVEFKNGRVTSCWESLFDMDQTERDIFLKYQTTHLTTKSQIAAIKRHVENLKSKILT